MPPSRTAELLDTAAPLDGDRLAEDAQGLRPPAIEILFHADLRRVGGITDAWDTDADGVLTLGRRAPLFVHDQGAAAPLDDRFVSRAQLLVRANAGCDGYEIAPAPEARQPVRLVALDGASPQPITHWQRVPDGALVAIGRRVLLRLGRAPRRGAAGDRLGLVGESEALWALRARIETVARFQESALILGETGTGKELVARALHRLSGATGPFVALNMGGLDAGTAGSELFGHVRGAFTGAQQNRVGAFEAARHGTVFLDEIGDLAPDIQKKLLRVLEDRRFTPLGSHPPMPLECRVVAATHCPLSADVDAGHFRRDLFERLRALTIPVPPLRQRREDVPRLFVRFLSDLSARHPDLEALWAGVDARGEALVPLEFVLDLLRHAWPGNVRELRNVATATAAATLAQGRFTPGELAPTPAAVASSSASPASSPRRTGAEVAIPTTEAMESALEACRGNVRAAAERLGCSRHQLYRWMEARGLDLGRFRGSGAAGE